MTPEELQAIKAQAIRDGRFGADPMLKLITEVERLKGVEAMHEDAEADATTLMAENAALREALDTYAQFTEKGEITIVSGFLAKKALSRPGPGAAYQERLRLAEVAVNAAEEMTKAMNPLTEVDMNEVYRLRSAFHRAWGAWHAALEAP